MSRCFPFPPPGYELKGRRPNDVDLITKETEKHKKQKDKKDKKDKEKKEKCERKEKEKEKGEDKHKDKKDKKRKREKHRDQKDKNKDKPSSSGETSAGPLENQNDQKLVPDSKPTDRIQEERTVVELGNRVKNDGATGMQLVQKITFLEKEKANLPGKVRENGNGRLVIKDPRARSSMANGQTLHVDSRSLQKGRNGYGENQITVEEGKERNVVGGNASKSADQNKNPKAEDKKGKEEKRELTGFRKDEIKLETSNGNFLDFHSNISSDLLKKNSYNQGKLPKLKELNGFLHAKNNGGVRPNNISRHAIASHHARPQNALNVEVVGKRAAIADPKVNGKLSSPQSVIDNVRNIGPSKTENGRVRVVTNGVISPHIVRIQRKTEPCQTSNSAAMAKQITNSSLDGIVGNQGKMAVQVQMPDVIPIPKMMHKKESGMNGSVEGKKHSSSTPSSASLKRKEKVPTTTTKLPHPDMKFLIQILAIPEVELPLGDDDQEWLVERPDSETKRPRLASPETKQVWSEAAHLKSADVTALPYVIPY